MEIYFDTDYITVKYDEVYHILIVTWKLPTTSPQFREGMMAMLEATKHYKAGRMVSDVVNLGAILEEDRMADNDVSTAYFNRMEDAIRWVIIPQQMHNTGESALKKNSTDK